jgi:hypothetical protein
VLDFYFGLHDPIRQPEKSASDHFFEMRELPSCPSWPRRTLTLHEIGERPNRSLVRIPSLSMLARAIRRAERRDHVPIYRVFVIDLVA